MLQQNFKTPEQLDIKAAEFDALRTVLGMLERGELTHTKEDGWELGDSGTPGQFFNMAGYGFVYSCGSIGCYAGWARIVTHDKVFPWANEHNRYNVEENLPPALNQLFFPSEVMNWEAINTETAARALRNYLTFGEPRWEEITEVV